MVITEKIKKDLQAFMSARAVAGEGSLKTWGRMQKPPITGTQAEQVADALVKDNVLEKEERASGYVWRKKIATATAPVSQKNEAEKPEEAEEDKDEEAEEVTPPPTSVERTGEAPAPPAPCGRCEQLAAEGAETLALAQSVQGQIHRYALSVAEILGAPAEESWAGLLNRVRGLREKCDHVDGHRRHLAEIAGVDRDDSWQTVLQGIGRRLDAAQARPIVEGGAITAYLLDLTDEQWSVVLRERHHLSEARQLRAKAVELEERAARTLEGLLDDPALQASAPAPCPAPSGAAPRPSLVPDPDPAPHLPMEGTLQARVLDLVGRGFDVAPTLAKKLHETHKRVTSALGILRRKGLLDCPAPGRYALAKSVRRAA